LAAAGLSAAAITVVGTVTEIGLIAYAAYDVGKTAVEVKEDLDAGRLDAAASKVGGLTGTIIGGVGASKVLGKGVTGAAGEVVEQASVRTIGKPQASLGGLETSEGEAIFWSGIGRGGEAKASDWATRHGGSTLETLLTKRGITMPPWDPVDPLSVAVWRNASLEFAAGAKGKVRVLQGDGLRVDSIWKDEFKALQNNPLVESVISVNPDTGVELLIWSR